MEEDIGDKGEEESRGQRSKYSNWMHFHCSLYSNCSL